MLVLEIFLIVLNLVLFVLVWQLFKAIGFISDMVKFFILTKWLKGVRKC